MSDNPVLTALTRLEAGQEKVQTRLTGLEAGQEKVQARLTRLEAGQEKLQTELTGVQAELTGLETSQEKLRVDLMARMDRLQDSLSGVRDDIVTNFGVHLSDSERLDHTRDELRDLSGQMNQLILQVRKLADRVRVLEGGP
jgi:chromosome segregation ATPase